MSCRLVLLRDHLIAELSAPLRNQRIPAIGGAARPLLAPANDGFAQRG